MPGRKDPAPRRVVAWGRSVLASALVAGLAQKTALDVVQVEATLPAALGALRRKQVHAVVCDLASVPAGCVLTLLAMHPQLEVVIVDPDADHATVLTCRRPPMRTIDDLVAALLDCAGGGADLAPGPAGRTQ
jgi:DNA-binding NarL/FixJ family response regulator